MKVLCGDCRFWQHKVGQKTIGECRRHPPMVRDGSPKREWIQTSSDDWCGEGAFHASRQPEGAFQGEGVGVSPVVPSGMEVDVAQLGRPASESMIVNRKAYNQLRSRVSELTDKTRKAAKPVAKARKPK